MNRKAVSLVLGGAMLISAVSGMNAGVQIVGLNGHLCHIRRTV